MLIEPGLRRGAVKIPPSKSHFHRILVAEALAGSMERVETVSAEDCDDIKATKRCLAALMSDEVQVELDVGESGSTLRFLAPLAAALGKRSVFKKAGRLSERPMMEYPSISPGVHELPGGVSSQFATGLIFALPLLDGDSEIRFSSRLESRGYVDMTLDVVRAYGIKVVESAGGFFIPGNQKYVVPKEESKRTAEKDWSGAAFWICANAIGNSIEMPELNGASRQPDRAVVEAVKSIGGTIDVSEFPDSFPALTIAAACKSVQTTFTGISRLRLKESDRIAAMAEVLAGFGVKTEVSALEFRVLGTSGKLKSGSFKTYDDHRIAMSIAIGATRAVASVEIDNSKCVAKSYPLFFQEFAQLGRKI